MVEIGGTPYLDGGLADSIPILRAMEKGWRKNIVVLTRNAGYRKKPPHAARALYQAAYTKYPELLKTLLKRARMYNRTLAAIEKWEREGRIFVIRPQMKAIGRLESDPRLLEAFDRDGYGRYAGSMRRCRPIFKNKETKRRKPSVMMLDIFIRTRPVRLFMRLTLNRDTGRESGDDL